MDALTVDDLVDRAAHDPAGTLAFVAARLATDTSQSDRAALLFARGVASRARNDVDAARADLDAAVALATEAGDGRLAARASVSLAAALAYAGEVARALELCESAASQLRGRDRVAALGTAAGLLVRAGRMEDAEEALTAAARSAQRIGDADWQGRSLNNRAILRAERGDLGAARRDLQRADECFAEVGAHFDRVDVLANRAWIAGLAGELPMAIDLSMRAESEFRELGATDAAATVAADRALALLRGGLIAEAESTARFAAEALEAQGMVIDAAEARLVLAEAALAGGHARRVTDIVGDPQLQRGAWRDRTVVLAGRVAIATGSDDVRRLLPRTRAAARRLQEAGLRSDALAAHLVASELAARCGGRPATDLRRAASVRSHGLPVLAKIDRSVAAARLALETGDALTASRAVARGLRLLAEHRVAFAGEAAVAAATGARRLEQLAAAIARSTGDGTALVRAMTAARDGTDARLVPPGHRRSPGIVRLLDDVRRADDDRSLARAERALRLRLLADSSGPGRTSRRSPPDGRTVVMFTDDGTQALATVSDAGGHDLIDLGPVSAVVRAAGHVRHAHASAARLGDGGLATDAIERMAEALAPVIDRLEAGGDGGVVVVPSGRWPQPCWNLLPGFAGRAVAVAPTPTMALRAADRWQRVRRRRPRVVAVADPSLPNAGTEVATVLAAWGPGAIRLDPSELPDGVAGAGIAHFACHGRLRSDCPLFSALDVGDRRVAWHQLVALDPMPNVVVLAACDVGETPTTTADIPVGGPAALLAAGTSSVIAATGPVNDDAAAAVLGELHRRLAAGEAPSAALAKAGPSPLVPLVAFGV